MAKADGMSFLEQHLEKLVLAGCLVLLGLAVMHWVASSPVGLTVLGPAGRPTANVSPEQVDAVLLKAAQNVERTYDNAKMPVPPIPRWAGRTDELRTIAPGSSEPVDLALPHRPLQPFKPPSRPKAPTVADLLAKIPPLPRPAVSANWELPRREPLDDVLVARGLVAYALAEHRRNWEEVLKDTNLPFKIIVQQVIVEIQQLQADGKWGPVRRVVTATAPGADGKPLAVPELPKFTGNNAEDVRNARNVIGEVLWQTHICQPEYYTIYIDGAGWGRWQPNLPKLTIDPGQMPVWFHDDSTMKINQVYRYRMQLVFVNPLLTYADVVDKQHAQDAYAPLIAGPASEWSEPVSQGREVTFRLTGASETTQQMTVTVTAFKWGQRIANSFRVTPGEPIGTTQSVAVVNPLGPPGEKRMVPVDFSTGAVALRFNFHKTIFRRGFLSRTAEMIYLTPDGKLKSRVLAWD